MIGFEEGRMSNDVLMAFILGILVLAVFIGRRSQQDDDNTEVRTANNKNEIRCEDDGSDEATSEQVCTSCEENISKDVKRVSICGNCGKKGNSDDMNTCNKCNEVKYCNAACKKKHRSKHKKVCERRVAENMRKLCSSNHQRLKIVIFVWLLYLSWQQGGDTWYVAERLCVVDVFMLV